MSRKFKEMLMPANINRLFMRTFFFRNRVVAMASPGVAAHYALCGKPAAIQQAVFLQCFHSIVGAGRGVAAYAGSIWRYCHLVKPYQEDKRCRCQFFKRQKC